MSAKKTERKHAILPASGAERWLHCTPSARLEESLTDERSEYAAEGTLAHSIAELKIRKKFVEPMGQRSFHTKLNKLKKDPLYQPEMESCTDDYLDYVSGVVMQYPTVPHVAVEIRLDLDAYVPESFGTGDCIVIGGKTLHVIDYKHGKGVPVDVEDNPQLKLYGLGALQKYQMLYLIDTVALTVFQPRADGDTIKEWSLPAADLMAWGESIKPVAQQAFAGEGDFTPGGWCQFCRARHTCRHRAGMYTALQDFGGRVDDDSANGYPMPPLLSDQEVGQVLDIAVGLEKWVSDLKDYALAALLAGGEIPGWKAVEGRSTRAWDDQTQAFTDIKAAGIDEAIMYERKPLTLAALEKVVGKAKFMEIAGSHIIKPPGKPTLAPEGDKRDAITARPTAEEDFKNLEEEK